MKILGDDLARLLPAGSGAVTRLVAIAVALAGTTLCLLGGDLFSLLFFGPYAVAGTVLAIRRATNPIGWLLLAAGWAMALATLRVTGSPSQLQAGTAPISELLAAWASGWGWAAAISLLLALTVLFPTGVLPSRRRSASAALIGASALCTVGSALAPTISVAPVTGPPIDIPNPLAALPGASFWAWIPGNNLAFAIGIALFGIAAGSLVVRYRVAVGLERFQLRWLVASLVAVSGAVALGFGVSSALGASAGDPRNSPPELLLAWLPAMVALPAVPAAIGTAVLRYRLYEIDRIISRTVSWALVTGVLVAVFVAAVVGLQAILAGVTQGQTLAVACSTIAALALFQPLRRRVQAAVDRRFDRTRYDAERTVVAFSRRLRGVTSLDQIEGDMVATVDQTVRPLGRAVWLRRPG